MIYELADQGGVRLHPPTDFYFNNYGRILTAIRRILRFDMI